MGSKPSIDFSGYWQKGELVNEILISLANNANQILERRALK
jgi:hypothetical protein